MYDLATGSHDHDWPEPAPLRSVVVCTTTRSGSTLLGEALHRVGGLGCPLEYLHRGFRPALARRWGTSALAEYWAKVVHHRTDPATGVLSVKLFWTDLVETAVEAGALSPDVDFVDPERHPHELLLLGRFLRSLLPSPTFVLLWRIDAVRRAVSAYRADWSKRFRCFDPHEGAEVPPYDRDAIHHHLLAQNSVERAWEAFFAADGSSPTRIRYEDLVADYGGTVGRLLRDLGHADARQPLPPPRLHRQADAASEELCRRFLADHRASR